MPIYLSGLLISFHHLYPSVGHVTDHLHHSVSYLLVMFDRHCLKIKICIVSLWKMLIGQTWHYLISHDIIFYGKYKSRRLWIALASQFIFPVLSDILPTTPQNILSGQRWKWDTYIFSVEAELTTLTLTYIFTNIMLTHFGHKRTVWWQNLSQWSMCKNKLCIWKYLH